MGQGHVSCPGGIDRVKIIDRPQELTTGGSVIDGGDDLQLLEMRD
jgi:hypothetical protein